MSDHRTDVPRAGGERELLRAYLDFHRETLALKCAGLTDDELRRRNQDRSTSAMCRTNDRSDSDDGVVRRRSSSSVRPAHFSARVSRWKSRSARSSSRSPPARGTSVR